VKLVVTGASGFIGRAVVETAMRRGHKVVALLRSDRVAFPAEVEVVHADLAEAHGLESAFAGADAVVHCAASMGTDPREQQRDTVVATQHLLDALARANVRRIVLASSLAVYDHLRAGERLDETTPLESDTDARGAYIVAKLEQERLVRESGLDARILRPGIVWGPGRGWFYHLGATVGRRLWIALAGAAKLPLVHVESCAEAFVLAAEVERGGFTLNVIDDGAPTRTEYLRRLASTTEPVPIVLSVPWGLLKLLASSANLFGVRAGTLHPARLAARCRPLEYSNEAARRTLGWKPRSF
jgi:nucleoside-diphosphate-sugar epimerase